MVCFFLVHCDYATFFFVFCLNVIELFRLLSSLLLKRFTFCLFSLHKSERFWNELKYDSDKQNSNKEVRKRQRAKEECI